MSGVNAVAGAQGAQGTTGTSKVSTDTGKVVISFQGQTYELTKKQADQYNELLYSLNYAKNKISELKVELGKKDLTAKRKAEIQKELKSLQEQYARQQKVASFEILPSQSGDMFVQFTMKESVDAEEFKSIYNLKDGSLRPTLKKTALEMGPVGGGYSFKSYDDVWWDSDLVENPGSADAEYEFTNGVRLVASDDMGHYYPDYTEAVLGAGQKVSVAKNGVQDPNKSWWEVWK